MNPVKIIFFDIDGTLLNPQNGLISDKTHLALTRLKERGIKICISTGRAPSEVPDFGPMKFDAYCTYNGSLCYAGNEILHSNPIAAEDVAQVIRNAAGIGRHVSVATRKRLAANGWDPDLADYYRLANLTLTAAPDFDAACQEDVYQILIGCRRTDHAAILNGAQGVKIAVSWDRAVDVIPASSGKGIAIAKAEGKYKGRKTITVDKEQFEKLYAEVIRGERTNRYVMQKMNLKPNTYYRLVNEYKTKTGQWA